MPNSKSSKLAVPYILGVEMGKWSQKTLLESDESYTQFSQKIIHMPTTLNGQITSGTYEQPSSKPILSVGFPPPQVKNLHSKSLNQKKLRVISHKHIYCLKARSPNMIL